MSLKMYLQRAKHFATFFLLLYRNCSPHVSTVPESAILSSALNLQLHGDTQQCAVTQATRLASSFPTAAAQQWFGFVARAPLRTFVNFTVNSAVYQGLRGATEGVGDGPNGIISVTEELKR
jgi:hypothetical protein